MAYLSFFSLSLSLFLCLSSLCCFFSFSLFAQASSTRVVITVIARSLDDMFVDYIYRRRNPRRCSVAIYRWTTSTSSLVPATKKPPSMKSYTYETYITPCERLSTGHSMEIERSPRVLSGLLRRIM